MKKILTVIFDGFGMRDETEGNAIKAANMTNFNSLWDNNPHCLLSASEESVGLLPGQMGNSEVGHMTIGAGRLVKSNKTLVNDFLSNPIGSEEFDSLIANPQKRVHLMGLYSDGNTHSGIDNIISMYNILVAKGFKQIYFHMITDGRDTKVNVAAKYINQIITEINKNRIGSIATICGRYYAMDRDENYDRTKLYYDLVTNGKGQNVLDIGKALKTSYEKGVTDEFIKPMLINANGVIKDDDVLIWMNYRADRAKQIMRAFVDPHFDEFDVIKYSGLQTFSLLSIDKNIKTKILIDNNNIENPLGIYLSKLGIHQARVSESAKFPHITYFFDGGYNGKIEGCDKYHIPSPDVSTYDKIPEMSAVGVTKKVIDCMEKDYDFILVNYANPDMVGHTGDMEATKKACMTLDVCLNKLVEVAEENFYTLILLADHGNADTMINNDGSICTTHSLAKVPFIICDPKVTLKESGDLTNVAVTILDYMDITIPNQMTSSSLIETE